MEGGRPLCSDDSDCDDRVGYCTSVRYQSTTATWQDALFKSCRTAQAMSITTTLEDVRCTL